MARKTRRQPSALEYLSGPLEEEEEAAAATATATAATATNASSSSVTVVPPPSRPVATPRSLIKRRQSIQRRVSSGLAGPRATSSRFVPTPSGNEVERPDLDSMSRTDLQALCKQNSLKANGKTIELIERLREHWVAEDTAEVGMTSSFQASHDGYDDTNEDTSDADDSVVDGRGGLGLGLGLARPSSNAPTPQLRSASVSNSDKVAVELLVVRPPQVSAKEAKSAARERLRELRKSLRASGDSHSESPLQPAAVPHTPGECKVSEAVASMTPKTPSQSLYPWAALASTASSPAGTTEAGGALPFSARIPTYSPPSDVTESVMAELDHQATASKSQPSYLPFGDNATPKAEKATPASGFVFQMATPASGLPKTMSITEKFDRIHRTQSKKEESIATHYAALRVIAAKTPAKSSSSAASADKRTGAPPTAKRKAIESDTEACDEAKATIDKATEAPLTTKRHKASSSSAAATPSASNGQPSTAAKQSKVLPRFGESVRLASKTTAAAAQRQQHGGTALSSQRRPLIGTPSRTVKIGIGNNVRTVAVPTATPVPRVASSSSRPTLASPPSNPFAASQKPIQATTATMKLGSVSVRHTHASLLRMGLTSPVGSAAASAHSQRF